MSSLIANPPPGAPVPPILPPQDGFLFLDKAKFAASFAADVPPKTAAFMADSQVPWGVEALAGAVTDPAWKAQAELVPRRHRRPDDPAAGPARDGQARRRDRGRGHGSHAIYVSQPKAVAALIEQAAEAVGRAGK